MGESRAIEADLWVRARANDSQAFAEIFDLHRDRVFRHVAAQLPDRRDAEDAMATAFLELWRRRTSVRVVKGSVLPWLLVTASNASRNLGRSTRRYRAILSRLPRERGESALDVDGERLARLESDQSVSAALRELHPTDAALVSLTALEGYPIFAAAQAVGITPGAARVRLFRARQRLRATFPDQIAEGPS